ncbi:PDZ domain-containing protein [Ditylenchus destructor]|uniref:26S proteasome non-ATPase regulatory subunit 9 n=1 Tax=Ditylenchus destructor TaxID=166010 RepID=A0AAD4R0G2_9BILA|nr:PDZ domain-containing protein [Ditylenchus destructor]
MKVNEPEVSSAKMLMHDVDEVDRQIREKYEILAQNNADMNTPLVDDEGFPVANIDIPSVRQARHDIICLQNDRRKLLLDMDEALKQLHQEQGPNSPPDATEATSEPNVHRTSNDPILAIQSVEFNSPAAKANFKVNDLVIQFGTLHAGNYEGFNQLKEYVQKSINKPIKITIFREHDSNSASHVHRLELCPQNWSGEGVLGCTFVTPPKNK